MRKPHTARMLAAAALLLLSTAAAAQGAPLRMHTPEELTWVPFGAEGKAAFLWGDRKVGPWGMLLKFPPGYRGGAHSHTLDYHGITVAGTWTRTAGGVSRDLPVGSYVLQPGKQVHSDGCKGPEECVFLIHQAGPGDYIPAERH